ncbi:MAG: Phosphoglucomutase [Chlamydiae bacterium]|nr:Phosphoglucomutase [Chlamydiota bacterium]
MTDSPKHISFDKTTQKHVDMWLQADIDEETKATIRNNIQNDPQEVINAFYSQLSFGTGGLRGLMGIGTNRMNQYTIRMATQGLVNYLSKHPEPKHGHSVFIGYDCRNNSRFFAEETAKVLAGNEIRVFLCSELRPTPFVSFGCRYKHCSAAIMITASHNPPEYNGYKVYWSDGGQIVPPHDKGIIEEVRKIKDLSMVKSVNDLSSPLITIVDEDVDEAYLQAIGAYALYPEENRQFGQTLNVVYSSLHGTGITLVPDALKSWGFTNITIVEEQSVPNGNFPTVKSPNPEERSTLQLGIETLEKKQADLFIATDPDADRVGIVVNHMGEALMLNGNQIACLCLYHICEALTKQNRMPRKVAFIKTIATTELFKTIAETYGAACFDVLTGFKYIAELMNKWEEEPDGYHYVFGGEESYGYLLGTHARDKDAVISSALICEVALHAKRQGKTLIDVLYEIYQKFGVYFEKLVFIKFEESKEGKEQMVRGMKKLRDNPPREILGIPVDSMEDYQTSKRTHFGTGTSEALTLPKSDVLLFWLKDGSKLMIRPSGTEPKIKIYCSVKEEKFSEIPVMLKKCEEHTTDLLQALTNLLN